MSKETPHDPYSVPLFMDPFKNLMAKEAFQTTYEDEALIWNQDIWIPDLHALMCRPGAGIPFEDLCKGLSKGADDAFDIDRNLLGRPIRDPDGVFAFSLLFALKLEDAKEILGAKSQKALRSQIKDTVFRIEEDDDEFVAIGYGTLRGSFEQKDIMIERSGDRAEGEAFDPQSYVLHLHPDSFFISKPFRGRKLGLLAGAALANPIVEELWYLADLSLGMGIETKVEINTYFEILSDGGEAAVNNFHASLEIFKDALVDTERPELRITEIEMDGDW